MRASPTTRGCWRWSPAPTSPAASTPATRRPCAPSVPSAAARGRGGRGPGVLPRPGGLRSPAHGRRGRGAHRLGPRAGRGAHRDRAGVRDRGRPTSSRTERSTTGWWTTRSRRRRCWPGAGRCRCSGCPARRSCGWPTADGSHGRAGGVPGPGLHRGGAAGAARPARRAGRGSGGDRRQRRRDGRAGDVRSLCVHGDSPGAVEAAAAVRAALARAGYDVRPWSIGCLTGG